MAHIHRVYDTGTPFKVNAITRVIKNDSGQKIVLTQYDHNSERFTFEIPRYIDGHDMATCNLVRVHYNNIDLKTKVECRGLYEVEDLQVVDGDDSVVYCSWLVSANATQFSGALCFLLEFICTTNSILDYAWHSAINSTDVTISDGMNNSDFVVSQYADVLEQWRQELFNIEVVEVAAKVNQLSTATEILDRQKGDAIVCEASGETIAVSDASDDYLRGLKLYGKTTQDGTPTPDSPVELVSVGDSGSVGVTVAGKNLIENLNGSGSKNGIDYAVQSDGSVICTGTTTDGNAFCNLNYVSNSTCSIPPGTYIVSGGKDGASVQVIVDKNIVASSADGAEKTFTVPETAVNSWCRLNIYDAAVTVNTTIYPMVRLASILDNAYAPYQDGGSLTAQTPNGLPGIPVASGGNYTDADGQQWICDEVDFDKGVYVQRVKQEVVTGSSKTWGKSTSGESLYYYQDASLIGAYTNNSATSYPMYCNQYVHTLVNNSSMADKTIKHTSAATSYGLIYLRDTSFATLDELKTSLNENPIIVLCILATPIETALTAEELATYAALHTNKPNTTVYNDSGAYLDLAYNADPKTYIDNKFAELTAAIVYLGGNV